MGNKQLAQFFEKINGTRLQARVPASRHFPKSQEKFLTKHGVRNLAEQHENSETLQVIEGVPQPIIRFYVGDLKVSRDDFLYDLGCERRADVEA